MLLHIYNFDKVAKYIAMKSEKRKGIFCGAAAGFVNGLLGGGGGTIAVILLKKLLKLSPKKAHSAALAIMLPTTVLSAVLYSFGGVYSANVYPLALGVFAGGMLGANLLQKISGEKLSLIFAAVLFISGLKMVL